MTQLPKATEMAHELAAKRIRKKNTVVDATAGNGHDTLFLADEVGASGKVYAVDIQESAIETTRKRLEKQDMAKQVIFKHGNHSDLATLIPKGAHGKIPVVMFNLGYLPSGDKAITTTWESTLPAIRAALSIITATGLVTITLYPGHAAGKEEANAVLRFAEWLDPSEFRVARYDFLNLRNDPPFLVAIEPTAAR